MRIIKRLTLDVWSRRHPDAKSGLKHWYNTAKRAVWTSLQDVRKDFGHADPVTVKSGKTVVVFNISKNKFRLITAIHHNSRKVFLLKFLTHAEYSRKFWKEDL